VNPQTPNSDAHTVRAVDRALDIMALIDEERNVVTLRDVLAKTSLPKTTALRLLQTLEQNGMLHATGSGEFAPGLNLLRWARLASSAWVVPPEAGQILESLATTCRETVNVYVRRKLQRVCIAQREGPQTLRQVVHVGDELPLWAGGAAKILLLDASDDLLEAVAELSPAGPLHVVQLRAWVAEAREAGYASSRAEREVGLASIAVPVRSHAGTLLAALSLGGPSDRFTSERLPEMARELGRSAQALERGGYLEHLPVQRS
jgi:DNA-binding IclR family transcriptional regulator